MKSEKINTLPHPFLHWFHHLVVYYGCIGYFSIYAFVLCNCLSLYRPLIIICITVLFTCLSHTWCHVWMIDPIRIFLIWSNGWCIQGGRKCTPMKYSPIKESLRKCILFASIHSQLCWDEKRQRVSFEKGSSFYMG
jgi:hypothetical protein